jgi:Spy/CpxP family protein refolding chaperone
MKKLGLLFMLMIFATASLVAQNRDGQRNFDPEEMAKRQTENLKKEIGLDDKQEKKVYELTLDNSKKMMGLREKYGDDREGMREEMMKIREDGNKGMKEILSDKQWKKYEQYLKERREGRGQRGRPGSR